MWFKTTTAPAALLSTGQPGDPILHPVEPEPGLQHSGQLQGGFYSGNLTTIVASDVAPARLSLL